jgi:UDP-2,3-diacylglucosamine hydrolase
MGFFVGGGMKSIYLLSDFHLGSPSLQASRSREHLLLKFFEETQHDASAYYLLGDVFDFWFELRRAVPKHFVRLQGCLARLTDKGLPVHYFTGNHDGWTFGYLEEELGVILHRDTLMTEWDGKRLLLAHGDGKGPGDQGYKRLKKVFNSPLNQRLFSWLHPDFSFGIAQNWSRKSRASQGSEHDPELPSSIAFDPNREWLYHYCLRKQNEQRQKGESGFDYLVFGHRHLPIFCPLPGGGTYVNLGEWIDQPTYGRFRDGQLELLSYPSHQATGYGRTHLAPPPVQPNVS